MREAFEKKVPSFDPFPVKKAGKLCQTKKIKKNIENLLTNQKECGIIYAVIQRQQVPVKAQAFLPRRKIESLL